MQLFGWSDSNTAPKKEVKSVRSPNGKMFRSALPLPECGSSREPARYLKYGTQRTHRFCKRLGW